MTKYINYFIKTSFVIFLLFAFFVVTPVFAAEIRLDSQKSEIFSGEQFLIDLVIHSEESLNAIEGRLIFPEDKLLFKEIRDGNSVINFWIDKPQLEAPGVIFFAGITPGGWSGANNDIFSVLFEAKNTGIASIILQDTKALQNDGLGSQIALLTHDTAVFIKSGDGNLHKEIFVDRELPEDFNPTVESDPNIFDGRYFLIFATQDKRSGIDHYAVREGEFGRFKIAESPYLLENQLLDRKIFVKAIDKSDNERIAVLNEQQQVSWYRQYEIFGILLIVIVIVFLLKKLWLRFTK